MAPWSNPYGWSPDLTSGYSLDSSAAAAYPDPTSIYSGSYSFTPAAASVPTSADTGAIAQAPINDPLESARKAAEFQAATWPQRQQEYAWYMNAQRQANLQNLSDIFPSLQQGAKYASNLAIQRQVAKEQMPSNVQNIMASKQGQATSAATAEAVRAEAMAKQQDAATAFARGYAGQTFRTV
jgi:hypothetical protein